MRKVFLKITFPYLKSLVERLKHSKENIKRPISSKRRRRGGKPGMHWAGCVGRLQEKRKNSYSLGCTGRTSHRNSES